MFLPLLQVTAQETSTPERYESNVTIIINITDVNDHNPRCSQEVYKVTVDENLPNGTSVVQVLVAICFRLFRCRWYFLLIFKTGIPINYVSKTNWNIKMIFFRSSAIHFHF
jgi:hypothetical protein